MKYLYIFLVLITTTIAHAEQAVISGTLTIIANRFVVRMPEPFQTEGEDENGEFLILSSNEIQVICRSEDTPQLRALLGKKVMMEGDIFTANTWYHIKPILIDIQEGAFGAE
jgi:hypothetical protein